MTRRDYIVLGVVAVVLFIAWKRADAAQTRAQAHAAAVAEQNQLTDGAIQVVKYIWG